MSEPYKNNKTWSADDLERYHSGSMSAEEMHALEKASHEDPFLADALEGYAYTKTPGQDLADIRKRLFQKDSERKVFPIFGKQYFWMRIAAMVVVVAGGIFLLYKTTNNSNSNLATTGIKDTTVNIQQPATKQAAAPNADTTVLTDVSPSNPEIGSISGNAERRKTTAKKLIKETDTAPTDQASDEFVATIRIPETVPVASVPQKDQLSNDSYKNELAKAAAKNASVQRVQSDSLVSMNQRNAWMNRTDTNAVAYKDSNLDTVRLNVILEETKTEAAEEIVISKKAPPVIESRGKITIEEPEPATGWQYYNDYITAQRLKIPEMEIRSHGEVELEFDVDRNGRPVNITVKKSLCEKCDEAAIKILKEGPKWIRKNNKKGKVTIQF